MSAVLVQAARKRQPNTARELSIHWLLERDIVRESIREPIGEQDNKRLRNRPCVFIVLICLNHETMNHVQQRRSRNI